MKGVYYQIESELRPGVAPLSEEERAWVEALQSVLAQAPKRLSLVTLERDPALLIADREDGGEVMLRDGPEADCVLAEIAGGPPISSDGSW